jgi:hypothetical protein
MEHLHERLEALEHPVQTLHQHGNTHTQIRHPEVNEDGSSPPKDTLINTRRSFLTNFSLGSIAASAALLIGAANNPWAVGQTRANPLTNDKKDDEDDKDKEQKVQESPDLLVIFDPTYRLTLVGLATEPPQDNDDEKPQDNLVRFSAMAIEGIPAPIIEFEFAPDFIQSMEELPVNIPGTSMIAVQGFRPLQLTIDIDPQNEDVASGTLIDPVTLLHVDFLIRQFELQSPFSIRRFLRRALAVVVAAVIFVISVGTVNLFARCDAIARQVCGGSERSKKLIFGTIRRGLIPFPTIFCEFRCGEGPVQRVTVPTIE